MQAAHGFETETPSPQMFVAPCLNKFPLMMPRMRNTVFFFSKSVELSHPRLTFSIYFALPHMNVNTKLKNIQMFSNTQEKHWMLRKKKFHTVTKYLYFVTLH